MKPANDPNRQQPGSQVRPPGANIRTTSVATTSHNVVTTSVTSHIVSTGNPTLTSIKTIPVTASRVVAHTSATTLTLVGSGTSGLRPVSSSPSITSFRPANIANMPGPRGASPMMRNIVTAPVMTSAGSATSTSFVSGIRALGPRAPGSMTAVGPAVQSTWTGKPGATTPTKITTSLPSFPGGQGSRPTTSLTVRPVASAARPELATLRATKSATTSDKFIRTPARTTLAFTTPGQPGAQFQPGTTHLAVAPMPASQASSTALTLQPIVVGTPSGAKTLGAPRQTGLHPIGSKVITQPAHGPAIQITHLAGVPGKPGTQGMATGALQLARGPAPQATAGTPFATAPGGAQVKVLAQAPSGLLTDVLGQQTATTLIPSGSVFIQATQHTAVNVTPLERGTVVTSASYSLPSYIFDTSGGGGSLIATGPAHPPISHGATSHQLIRTFAPSVAQAGVATMQVQAGTFQPADDAVRKSFTGAVSNPNVGTMVGARFNQVMVVEASNRPTVPLPTTQPESSSEQHGQQQQAQPTPSSHSTVLSQPQPSHQPQLATTQPTSQPQSSQTSNVPAVSATLPTTPTTTPSKFSASPRPSILRKREHDGTPSKVQKNLGPVLAALSSASMSSSLPSSTASSPPPSPPPRPDSRDGKDGNGHSSAGSSTISATSSPGLPCDGDNNGGSQGSIVVKTEPADLMLGEASSNNGTNGNSDAMSPRKKPRKQQLTGNELQEPPYSDENAEFAEDKIKKEGEANHKAGQDGSIPGTPSRGAAAVSARRRPSVSLLQAYRSCWKPRNNHFLRPTDVRPREERRPTVAELSSQKLVVQRARGWKLHHLSTQMEEMGEREMDVLGQLSDVLEVMEAPRPGVEPTSKDLNRTNELIRSNMQRSKVVRDQLEEVRVQLLRLLEHTSPVVEIIKRNANRRQAKKKY